MKKITIMSIVLAILVAMTTSVFAAETISTTATVTAPATVTEGTKTVDITITFKDKLAYGAFNINLGTEGILKYKSNNVEAVQREDGSFAFAKAETSPIDKIVMTYEVLDTAKAGASTTVSFVPVAGKFGVTTATKATVTAEGTAPTVTVVAKQGETTPPAGENKPGNTTTNETTTTPSNETTTTPANETTTTPANETVTEKATSDDEYDQTGINVGVIAGIALAVVLGTAVVVKRK